MKMTNLQIDNLNKEVTLKFNMDMYSYEAIICTSKEFTDNFWVIVQGNPKEKIIVNLKPKEEFINDINLNELGYEFYNLTLGLMQNSPG